MAGDLVVQKSHAYTSVGDVAGARASDAGDRADRNPPYSTHYDRYFRDDWPGRWPSAMILRLTRPFPPGRAAARRSGRSGARLGAMQEVT